MHTWQQRRNLIKIRTRAFDRLLSLKSTKAKIPTCYCKTQSPFERVSNTPLSSNSPAHTSDVSLLSSLGTFLIRNSTFMLNRRRTNILRNNTLSRPSSLRCPNPSISAEFVRLSTTICSIVSFSLILGALYITS
jgi:hypothetical protein